MRRTCIRILTNDLGTEAVESTAGALEGVDDVESSDGLAVNGTRYER